MPRKAKPTQAIAKSFSDAESEMVANFEALLADENDTAVVSSAIKVLDAIKDPKTPEGLREKLKVIEAPARCALLDKAKNAKVATARSNANAYVLKRQQEEAPNVWPPDTESAKWKKDYSKALEQCQMTLPSTTSPTSAASGTTP